MTLYKEIENSFPMIESLLSEEDLLEFKESPIKDLLFYHFGLGTWIRNNLLNTKENCLNSLFLENGVEDLDDMSFYIIMLFHYHVSKKI